MFLSYNVNMLNKKLVIGSVIVVIFCFIIIAVIQTSIEVVNSTEVGTQIVVNSPFWVSEKHARDVFSIDPDIEGELYWNEGKLYFVPNDGFDPNIEYTVGTSNKLLALLPISKSRVVNVAVIKGETYEKSYSGEERYIDINLATMILTLYENNKVYKTFPVAGKGNPLLTATPEGEFSVKTKELNHFSRKARVWMPYSMQFSGDYFLHAWPYWPGGKKLTSEYSGGCIRLYDADAAEVFKFAQIGIPMIVHSTLATPLEQIQNGDIITLGADEDPYLIMIVNGKRFKRRLKNDEYLNWYPYLASSLKKPVDTEVFNMFLTSKWFYSPNKKKVYEIDGDWRKHLMRCSGNCVSLWEDYGWDVDEIFSITLDEFNSYSEEDTFYLQSAPK